MATTLEARVAGALTNIRNPRVDNDVISAGMVGLMDADVYGPNIPRMFGLSEKPAIRGNRIIPLERYGVKVMSLGLMVERDAPAIWRGPIITKIIQQFLRDVDWGTLDYLIVDL